ncbi:hypothetical protein [Leisingera aquaemixtae]|uniref:Sulfotransferase family protein n=1 Tax=Leisingera aquaemixtae TaxID=1396826 RepID=A0A0P1HAB1_9RHOB|nr:hypothetical protein [Leisingera aquaemixtae]CUI00283.1 hypothetical protein PHA8399_02410 [Leisingera aquaemixtae]
MFLSDEFVYVDLNKTGSVSVLNWLHALEFPPRQVTHHLKPDEAIASSGILKFATIRNPWDYYLSLWSYGVKRKRKSGPYLALTRFRPLKSRGYTQNPFRAVCGFVPALLAAARQDWTANLHLYADPNNPDAFRTWLRKVMDPKLAPLLSGAYYSSRLHSHSGLYSYRFCNLYCAGSKTLHSGHLRDPQSLAEWAEENCYIDRFLHTESLAADFRSVMIDHRLARAETLDTVIGAGKPMNASRSAAAKRSDFYDMETRQLVADRESLIINRFGYEFMEE